MDKQLVVLVYEPNIVSLTAPLQCLGNILCLYPFDLICFLLIFVGDTVCKLIPNHTFNTVLTFFSFFFSSFLFRLCHYITRSKGIGVKINVLSESPKSQKRVSGTSSLIRRSWCSLPYVFLARPRNRPSTADGSQLTCETEGCDLLLLSKPSELNTGGYIFGYNFFGEHCLHLLRSTVPPGVLSSAVTP